MSVTASSLSGSDRRHNLLTWIGVASLVLGLGLLVFWTGSTLQAVRGLLSNAEMARSLLDTGPLDADPDVVGELVYDLRRNVVILKRRVGWLARLGPAFAWLPRVGPLAAQAPDLLNLGDALTELAVLFWGDVAPFVAQVQQGVTPQELVPALAPALGRNMERKVAVIDLAQGAYTSLDVSSLPWRLQEPLVMLGEVLPLLDAVEMVTVMPDLLGFDQPCTYLIMALNEDELRPGGGFISGVGEVVLRAGDVITMTFRDSYAVDDFSLPYPEAPDPLRTFMGLDLMPFRDSNWSPDFPTAFETGLPLYRPGYQVEFDGAVALDQRAVQRLVAAFGPLTVPGTDQPVTGETLLAYLREAYNPDDGDIDGGWWRQRKSFMDDLASAVMQKLKTGGAGGVDWLVVAEAGLTMLQERHIQIVVDDPVAASELRALGWDGSLIQTNGDYLMPVEANVGYNKASTRMTRSIRYAVDLNQPVPEVEVTLTYDNLNQPANGCQPGSRYDPTYTQMMDRCYWAYVRLYVPAGATLLDASSHLIPGAWMAMGDAWSGEVQVGQDLGYATFAQGFLVPRGAQETLHFRYRLPPSILQHDREHNRWVYRLMIQKQAGVREPELQVSLRLPQDAVFLDAIPEALMYRDGTLFYNGRLSRDLMIAIDYRLVEE